MAVFEVLGTGPGHPAAEQIHRSVVEKLPNVSLRTVYQVLRELSELGELVMLDLGTGAVRYDHNLTQHHHLVCDECGAVVDIPAHLTEVQYAGVADLGVSVSTAELVMRGTCSPCHAAGSTTAESTKPSSQPTMQQLGDPHA